MLRLITGIFFKRGERVRCEICKEECAIIEDHLILPYHRLICEHCALISDGLFDESGDCTANPFEEDVEDE